MAQEDKPKLTPITIGHIANAYSLRMCTYWLVGAFKASKCSAHVCPLYSAVKEVGSEFQGNLIILMEVSRWMHRFIPNVSKLREFIDLKARYVY